MPLSDKIHYILPSSKVPSLFTLNAYLCYTTSQRMSRKKENRENPFMKFCKFARGISTFGASDTLYLVRAVKANVCVLNRSRLKKIAFRLNLMEPDRLDGVFRFFTALRPGRGNQFYQLEDAASKEEIMHTSYCVPGGEKTIAIELDSHYLIYNDGRWYALSKSGFHGWILSFILNRVHDLCKLDKRFVRDEKFDVNAHLDKALSMVPNGGPYDVKLSFLPELAHIAGINWHSTQSVAFEQDGSVTVRFRIDGLDEITWWLLRFGDKVQVLAPLALKQKIIQMY